MIETNVGLFCDFLHPPQFLKAFPDPRPHIPLQSGFAGIHDRMPVIVRHDDWEEWFSPGELAAESFLRITTPYRAEERSALAVSPLVNRC